jgi:hypothetical protein
MISLIDLVSGVTLPKMVHFFPNELVYNYLADSLAVAANLAGANTLTLPKKSPFAALRPVVQRGI